MKKVRLNATEGDGLECFYSGLMNLIGGAVSSSRKRFCFSLSLTVAYVIWITLLFMIVSPPIRIPMLPSGIRPHDFGAVLVAIFGFIMLAKGVLSTKLTRFAVFPAFMLYVSAVLLLPVLGLLFIPKAEWWMYVGDLRWAFIFVLLVVAASIYSKNNAHLFEQHLMLFWVWAIAITWLVLISQIYFVVFGGDVPFVVELWYPEGSDGRGFGFHSFRFAGPHGTISGLAMFGLVSFIAALLPDRKSNLILFFLFSGLFFVVASGSRTALMILGVVMIAYLLRPRAKIRFSTTTLYRMFLIAGAFGVVIWSAASYNIGRMQDLRRVERTLQWLKGYSSFYEASGRGGERWGAPIVESQSWSPIGTLVNSAHALDLQTFDSYYVLMWVQAGPFIVVPFLLLLIIAAWMGWRNYSRAQNFSNSCALAIVLAVPLFGLTQNTMTGLLGRVMLTVAVLVIMVASQRPRSLCHDSVP